MTAGATDDIVAFQELRAMRSPCVREVHLVAPTTHIHTRRVSVKSLVVYRLVHAPVTCFGARESGVRLPAREYNF